MSTLTEKPWRVHADKARHQNFLDAGRSSA
jgi:hypothetical protein